VWKREIGDFFSHINFNPIIRELFKKKVGSEGMSKQAMHSRYFQTSILPIISFTGTWNTVFPIKSNVMNKAEVQ